MDKHLEDFFETLVKKSIVEFIDKLIDECDRGVDMNDRIGCDDTLKWYFEGRKSTLELVKAWIDELGLGE